MADKEKCCGTCRWYRFNRHDNDYVCVCLASEFNGEEREEKSECSAWTEGSIFKDRKRP